MPQFSRFVGGIMPQFRPISATLWLLKGSVPEFSRKQLGVTIMQNYMMKARAGRRRALMLRSIHLQMMPVINVQPYMPPAPLQSPPQHQFLQRIALSESRMVKSY